MGSGDNASDGRNNLSQILLNGAGTGNFVTGNGFDVFTPFSITSGFTSGVNTHDFYVYNAGGTAGLRVEISGTADGPGLGSLALVLLPLLGVGRRMIARARRPGLREVAQGST